MRGTTSISDIYMPVLLNFSNSDKLNVIAQLAASLKENSQEPVDEGNDLFKCFSGNWENEKPTDEVVAGYRDGSYSEPNKKIEW